MGARGPKPLPANVHALRGNPSKLPIARMLDGTVQPPVEIPGCPKHLQGEARKEWRRLAVELEALGLISQLDRGAFSAYCAAWAEAVYCENKIQAQMAADPKGEAGMIEKTPSGYRTMSVWLQIRNRAYERMAKFAALFGLSPSDRARVTPSDLRQGVLPGMDKPEAPKSGFASFT